MWNLEKNLLPAEASVSSKPTDGSAYLKEESSPENETACSKGKSLIKQLKEDLEESNDEISEASLPELESSSSEDDSTSLSARGRSESQDGLFSWHVQDFEFEHDWHESYILISKSEAQGFVPPARRLTDHEVETIPFVVSETEYLNSQTLIIRCDGDHNTVSLGR